MMLNTITLVCMISCDVSLMLMMNIGSGCYLSPAPSLESLGKRFWIFYCQLLLPSPPGRVPLLQLWLDPHFSTILLCFYLVYYVTISHGLGVILVWFSGDLDHSKVIAILSLVRMCEVKRNCESCLCTGRVINTVLEIRATLPVYLLQYLIVIHLPWRCGHGEISTSTLLKAHSHLALTFDLVLMFVLQLTIRSRWWLHI